MSRPKVLFAAARAPYPLDTGAKIRSWHILAGFARRFDVEVLTYGTPATEEPWLKEAKHLGVSRVVMVDNPSLNRPVSAGMFARAALRGLPASVIKYHVPEFSARFREMIAEGPAVVHLEHVHLAGELAALNGRSIRLRKTLDAHNVECLIAERMRDVEPFLPRKAALALHARNMRRFETRAFGQFDMIMAVSQEDTASIATMTGGMANAAIIENGVDETYFTPGSPDEIRSGSMVFVGSMDWLPNVDAMIWFAREVLPLVRLGRPDCSLTIVGRAPRPEVTVLHDPANGVAVTGTVDDVRPFVRQAEVVIAPLRFGGGTRLKILEAFSMAKPVVSTTVGCEGIAYTNGEHLLLGDHPRELAKACLRVMNTPGLGRKIGERGRSLAHETYAWPAVIGRMHAALDRVLDS